MESTPTPFVMPRFSRVMWVSARAREAWEWKIARFAESWRQIEWLTVADKVRSCASLWVSPREFASLASLVEGRGLKAAPLIWRVGRKRKEDTSLCRVVVGRSKDLRQFRRAWKRGDDDAIGSLLGYPACCRAFFRKVFVEEGLTDVVWPMAVQTASAPPDEPLIEVSGAAAELNPFWAQLGLRLTPHYPCRFDCGESAALAKAFCGSARKFGLGKSTDAALEIFRWPVEWSSLHGIAEIRTPIVKTSTNADAADFKRVVRKAGSSFPEEGARGLSFAMKPSIRGNPLRVLS